MDEFIKEIIDAGGIGAVIVSMGIFIKYILTIVFLITGSLAFCNSLEKK